MPTVGVEPYMFDGYATLIAFGGSDTFLFFEREVTPPGVDGGGPIDVTTMYNKLARTHFPKQLYTLDKLTAHGAYATTVYAPGQMVDNIIGVNTTIAVTFPDGAQLAFLGWVDKFKPAGLKEGEMPLAELTIEPSNLIQVGGGAPFAENGYFYSAGILSPLN